MVAEVHVGYGRRDLGIMRQETHSTRPWLIGNLPGELWTVHSIVVAPGGTKRQKQTEPQDTPTESNALSPQFQIWSRRRINFPPLTQSGTSGHHLPAMRPCGARCHNQNVAPLGNQSLVARICARR